MKELQQVTLLFFIYCLNFFKFYTILKLLIIKTKKYEK